MAHLNEKTLEIELSQEDKKSLGICVGCGDVGTRTNSSLCQMCWYDTEGEND